MMSPWLSSRLVLILSLSSARAWLSPPMQASCMSLCDMRVRRYVPSARLQALNCLQLSLQRRHRHVNSQVQCRAVSGESRKLRILFADKLDDTALASLCTAGHEVLSQPEVSGKELVAAVAKTSPSLLVVRSTKVTADVIAASTDLELIIRAGAGVDNIDLAAAAKAGVKVANCAGANADAVTELALGLMLACDRRIVPQDQMLKRSTWAKGSFGDGRSKGLKGRVLGIVGFGRIGRRMSELGQALGMRIVAWSRSGISAPPPGVQSVDSLTALAEQSDVVSVHAAPGADGPLLEGSFFSAMKEGAIFVNVARGGVVDEEALLAAVKTRSILVGTDVYEGEPAEGAEIPFDNPLAQDHSVVATHHVGAATVQAQEAVALVLLDVINAYSTSNTIMNAVE